MTSLETALIIVVGVMFVALVILFVALVITSKAVKKLGGEKVKVDKIKVVDGVRYTKDDTVERNGEKQISHKEGDITLLRGKEYTVVKDGEIMPGKYSILTADGDTEIFNIRIGGFVREFTHNTPVVLADGDTICSVSHTVVLR